jgi:class 3 adenylate cyclase/tetratricopeptide (TPR) repeat protein
MRRLPLLGAEDHRMDVVAWLRGLGLEQYAAAFRDNDIDDAVLRRLTADDLRELGVASVGHRRMLLDAITAFGASTLATDTSGLPAQTTTAFAPRGDAERRQLTVMFSDLVGSTALSARLDPEDLREVIGAYHAAVAEAVAQFGGFVAKYMGDGVLIYFGYPQAHEDDAERAVRASLALVEHVARIETHVSLEIRIGIATGLVVVGDLIGQGEAQERGVVGETPNLAARLQALAPPGGLLIAETTRRLVGDLFEYEDLGAADLKGFDAGVPIWRVLRPSQVESRFEALRAGAAATPLIGRDEELDLLLRRWQRAAAGEGQLVLLSGEPGIGKSRLTAALEERLRETRHTRLRYFCSPHHQDSALYPFITQLERAAGFAREDTSEAKLTKLDTLLGPPDPKNAVTVGLIADLLSVPSDGHYPILPQDPQRRREAMLAALVAQLGRLAQASPVLMIFEDAHWADASSLELLDHTVEQLPQLPVLLIVTHRPEFAPPWIGQVAVTTIVLSRLGGREAAALAGNIAGGKRLPEDILDRIIERADGIPLFIEELTKSLIDGGMLREDAGGYALVGPLSELAIPSSLQASLLARLDRLAPVREVAQIGAAIGREFSHEFLVAVARRSEAQLTDALDQLTAAGLVLRRGSPPHASYVFKHALVQDAAYSTLLRGPRQELHARIAHVLAQRFPEISESQPEILAHHYANAGLTEQAVEYWNKAGEHASRASANAEAAVHFRQALALVPNLPAGKEKISAELKSQYALGRVLMATEGYASEVAAAAYQRAADLCEQCDDNEAVMRVLTGLRTVTHVQGDTDAARLHGSKCLEIAELTGHGGFIAEARASLSHTLCMSGAFVEAHGYLCRISDDYRLTIGGTYQPAIGLDPQVFALTIVGWNESILGYLDRGVEAARDAVRIARSLRHLQSLDQALAANAHVLLLRGAPNDALPLLDETIVIDQEQGFRFRLALAKAMRACAQYQLHDDLETTVKALSEAIAQYLRTGAQGGFLALFYAVLAEAHRMLNSFHEAGATLKQARSNTRPHWWDAELHRIEGGLLLAEGRPAADAEQSYQSALRTARRQHARLWELRAARDLARLWRDQGKRVEARELLAPVYGWFTEGFDTQDLKEAKTLLDELA